MNKHLYYNVTNNIAEITLARGPSNAFSLDFLNGILNKLKLASKDDNAKVVIIKSDIPDIFCAGLDLNIIIGKSGLEIREFLNRLYIDLWDTQYNMGKPTIAAINGAARGGGMTLAISCDMIIASKNSSFGYPEINLGLLPAIHFNHLPKIIGRYRAFELLFSGRTFYTDEAFSLGLLSKVTSEENFTDEIKSLATNLSQKSPTALKLGRAAFMRTNDLDYRRGVANAVEDFCNSAVTPDAQEGLKAFIERRKPIWE
ncbi:enoyl-CoA hydratase/isomerase family protein [Alphaproteobacteria bacterium]|nr:enoyl-CoA hydratase/isomerase family protein [Alphaproteobacteria bacterium]